MAYDPNFPPHGAGLVSAEWRDQFHGLKGMIDDILAGLPLNPVGADELNDITTNLIADTAKNVDAVPALDLDISDPPTHDEVAAVKDKLNELILALHRA